VAGFVETYNTQWLIGRRGHRTQRRPTRTQPQSRLFTAFPLEVVGQKQQRPALGELNGGP
jgi:hypothetical protein